MTLSRRALLKHSIWGGASLALASSTIQPVVQTTNGKIRGVASDGVNIFKGIRYGASTEGANRFLPPKKAEPWSGVRNAFDYAPMAMQEPEMGKSYLEALGGLYPLPPYPKSEDCLFLNIWTSELGKSNKRPVMVWLHPGGFVVGAGNSNWSDGANLARKHDVVLVSLNHRLSVFGHLYLAGIGGPKYAESGNVGMLDIVAALRWIQDNIAQFGGDPDNVTIFGESGGGGKVSTLMAMPSAKGLFHKAIIQSGAMYRAATQVEAAKSAASVLKHLSLGPKDLSKLHQLPAETLLQAASETITMPVVAGESLPRHPFDPDAPAVSAEVPMLIGTTKDEGLYFSLFHPPPDVSTEASVRHWLVEFCQYWGITDEAQADLYINAYRSIYPSASLKDTYYGVVTNVLRDDSLIQAERKVAQGKASTYVYLFNWESAALGGEYRSGHTVEIPFVFDNVDAAPQFFNPRPDARHYELASKMSQAWAAFAHNGDPSHPGLPPWKPYSEQDRATMLFHYTCQLANDPLPEERSAFQKLRSSRLPRLRLTRS